MFGNYQAKQERMDRELQEQNAKIQEQERIEKERIDEANRVQREQELQQLKFELNNAQVELELAKERLVKAKEFKFLRTAQEKENDIAVVVYEIKAVEETIQDLNSRISKY
jgi:1,4-alpha-glucan branching enzyme